jgi:predicted enzyme related to lactoylglutathione lyase
MQTHAANWFEIPVTDFDRARKFYSRIFDYDMPHQEMAGALMGFLPFEMGKGVGGAIILAESMQPSPDGPRIYLNGGDDLQPILDRVEAAGGQVDVPKTRINDDIGYFAVFKDSEGNRLALHSPPDGR